MTKDEQLVIAGRMSTDYNPEVAMEFAVLTPDEAEAFLIGMRAGLRYARALLTGVK